MTTRSSSASSYWRERRHNTQVTVTSSRDPGSFGKNLEAMVGLACSSQNMFSPQHPVILHMESQPCREGASHPAVCCKQWRPRGRLQREEVVLVGPLDPQGFRGDRHGLGDRASGLVWWGHVVLNNFQLSCQLVLWFQQLCGEEAPTCIGFCGTL